MWSLSVSITVAIAYHNNRLTGDDVMNDLLKIRIHQDLTPDTKPVYSGLAAEDKVSSTFL